MADLAQYVQQLTPVFITAPTARNGITLLQRLLNSSRQIIVYGESLDFMSTLPQLVYTTVRVHAQNREEFAQARKQFLEQTTEGWTSNLWPDPQPLMMIALDAFYKAAKFYQESSEQYGYARWGIKNPLNEAPMIDRIRSLMPKARFIFIYRHPFDVIKSAKSRQFIASEEALRRYALQWREILTHVVQYQFPEVLLIKYENLITTPDHIIDQLERFTGITQIDRTVMQRKINTFASDPMASTHPQNYIQPVPLSHAEKKIITEVAGDVMTQFGYDSQ